MKQLNIDIPRMIEIKWKDERDVCSDNYRVILLRRQKQEYRRWSNINQGRGTKGKF